MGRCKSCPDDVTWVVMARTGKRAPLNAEPDPERGNVLIANADDAEIFKVDVGQAITLAGDALTEERASGRDLYLNHFATCPAARSHRS